MAFKISFQATENNKLPFVNPYKLTLKIFETKTNS